jgi:hypothetical protein
MAKLVWRVKPIAELGSGIVSETEVARIERDDFAVVETVGLTLDEGKPLAAAAQAEIVRAQVAAMEVSKSTAPSKVKLSKTKGGLCPAIGSHLLRRPRRRSAAP